MLKRTTEPLRRRVLIEKGLAKSSKKQYSENTDKWHLCKAGSFSYGESPRTPPLEGTSLHWWNNDVERPWGILSLFTTCLRLWMKSHCHLLPRLQKMPPKAGEKKNKSPTKHWNEEVRSFYNFYIPSTIQGHLRTNHTFTVTLYQGKTVSHLNPSLKK